MSAPHTENKSETPKEAPERLREAPLEQQREALQDALRAIPNTEKEAFLLAATHGDEFLQEELDPVKFLQFEDCNAPAAADRLVAYWKLRLRILGDRAFLPIADLSGSGALSAQDLVLSKRGAVVQLPDDAEKDPVLFADTTRMGVVTNLNSAVPTCPRWFLYYLTKISKETCQRVNGKSGIVMIRLIVEEHWDHNAQPELVACELSVPIRFRAVRVLCAPTAKGRRVFTDTIMPGMQQQLSKTFGSRGVVHLGESQADLLELLEAQGLLKEGLPAQLGGAWRYERFDEWFANECTIRNSAVLRIIDEGPTKKKRRIDTSNAISSADKESEPTGDVEMKDLDTDLEHLQESVWKDSDADKKPTAIPRAQLLSITSEGRGERVSLEAATAPVQRQALQEALRCIPPSDKTAYLKALEQGSGFVENELDPLCFLHYEDYDATAAAAKLVAYWKLRAELFLDRAFLPISDLTGKGALSDADMEYGETGVCVQLPNTARGESVICVDTNRLTMNGCSLSEARKYRPRSLMYHFNKLVIENPMKISETKGVVFIRGITQEDRDRFRGLPQIVMLEDVMPLQFSAVRITCVPSAKGRRFFEETTRPVFQSSLTKSFGSRGTLHSGDSAADILRQLEEHGMERSGLPPAFGGMWSYDRFFEFIAKERYGEDVETPRTAPLLADSASVHVPNGGDREHSKVKRALPVDMPGAVAREVAEEHRKQAEPTATLTGPSWDGPAVADSDVVTPAQVRFREQLPTVASPSATKYALSKPAPSKTSHVGRTEVLDFLKLLPAETKAAYLEALERAPELVEKESGANVFYRFDGGDAEAAARRLAGYWTKRKEIFGDTRAFLPMTQTGEGALNRGDLNLLASCYFAQLINDRGGRPVLCYDGSRLEKCSVESRLRVAFYMFSVAVEAQADGCVMLCIKENKTANSDRDRRDQLGAVLDVLPIRIKGLHLIDRTGVAATGHRSQGAQRMVAVVHELFGDSVVRKTYVHGGTSRSEIAKKLAVFGLSKAGLPKSLGGDWGYALLTQWQELRTRLEWGLPPGAAGKEAYQMLNFSAVKPLSDLSKEEMTERSRRMNVIHSRRKRERERIEIEVLQEQCQEMGETNNALADENLRFERILTEGNSKVARFEGGSVVSEVRPSASPTFPSEPPRVQESVPEDIVVQRSASREGGSMLAQLYTEQALRDSVVNEAQTQDRDARLQLQQQLQQQRDLEASARGRLLDPLSSSGLSNFPLGAPSLQSVAQQQLLLGLSRQALHPSLLLQPGLQALPMPVAAMHPRLQESIRLNELLLQQEAQRNLERRLLQFQQNGLLLPPQQQQHIHNLQDFARPRYEGNAGAAAALLDPSEFERVLEPYRRGDQAPR